MTTAHTFKITKQQARIYTTCCGDTAEFYTSKEYGLVDSHGWYITNKDGESAGNRYATLRDAKEELVRNHSINLLNYINEMEQEVNA